VPKTTTPNSGGNLESGMNLALLGIVINVVFSVVKLLAGTVGHSHALIADGIESTLDIAGSFIIWGALSLASKPPDADHPYGHGKAEPVAAIVVSFAVLIAALGLAVRSMHDLFSPRQGPERFTLIVLIVVVVTKEILYRVVSHLAKKTRSAAIAADAGHHRADAISSLAAFIGIAIAVLGGKGWEQADNWAALFACVLIAWNGVIMLRPALYEIMDTAPPADFEGRVRQAAAGVDGVNNVQQCRIRKMGVHFYVDLHVWVNGAMTVLEGHNIAHAVKDAVRDSNPEVADVLVHIEPHG
jgi:cation diffusion facilitator family transporter